MKIRLMHRAQQFDVQQAPPSHAAALTQDLELDTLLNAMAGRDRFLKRVARQVLLLGLDDADAIRYRQEILRDCLNNPSVVRDLYRIATESAEHRSRRWMGIYSRYPSVMLKSSLGMLQTLVRQLAKLRVIADRHGGAFESDGFTTFFDTVREELDDEFFARAREHLRELRFRDGVLVSVELGVGNKGTHHVLRQANDAKRGWLRRFLGRLRPTHTIRIHHRDEAGARVLSQLTDAGVASVANALAQSADHIEECLKTLRTELAFYVGCLTLYERLSQLGAPVAFPQPVPRGERSHHAVGLYDLALTLTLRQRVVGNDLAADGKDLMIITGANQGGKSTFLRSIGLAQLMMQAGTFVPAESFRANICVGLYTHYRREEDATMESGKLDEELGRMSAIADRIMPDALVLLNESFAATNEREGSEIARQIIRALLERRVKVFFVTHLYQFAHDLHSNRVAATAFLRAERRSNGTRTFKIYEGEPLQTSYGKDLYSEVFGSEQ